MYKYKPRSHLLKPRSHLLKLSQVDTGVMLSDKSGLRLLLN